jgi:cobalamin biosynthesis protein CbiG
MDLEQAMIVAGVGCRAGASAGEIEAAIAAALDRAGLANGALDMIATAPVKSAEHRRAARGLSLCRKLRSNRPARVP